jgi:methylase of polypeptide subunit release factors
LKPRPSSESLVNEAVTHITKLYRTYAEKDHIKKNDPNPHKRLQDFTVLDLGCGSGALLLSVINQIEHDKAGQGWVFNIVGVGLDLDERALNCAIKNADRYVILQT